YTIIRGGIAMVPTLFFYQLGLVALGCVFLLLCLLWPNDAASSRQPIGLCRKFCSGGREGGSCPCLRRD
ncbi:MAG TPA: hypothetical protein VI542_38690, partial [Candidatus Tectomicrobia bacterium]